MFSLLFFFVFFMNKFLKKLKIGTSKIPENIPHGPLTPFAQAMSHYPMCKVEGAAVKAYRNYYHVAKDFAGWEWKRPAPSWWEGYKGASLYS